MSQAFATSSPPSRSARALHRAEDISTALKASVNVYKRQLVNEVLGPLITEFVRNFGREDATPYQRSSNASLLVRIQAAKLIRHGCAPRHLEPPYTHSICDQAICRRRRHQPRRPPLAKI